MSELLDDNALANLQLMSYMQPTGRTSITAEEKALYQALLAEQQRQADIQKKTYEEATKLKPEPNLKSFARATDLLAGTNIASQYNQDETDIERKKQLMALQKVSGDAQLDVLKSKLEYLKALSKDDLGWAKLVTGMKSMPTDKQAESIYNMEKNIKLAEGLIKDYKPGYTGYGMGFATGNIGKYVFDDKIVEFAKRAQRIVDSYRVQITGSAAAEKELERIEANLPQVTDPEKTFKSKARGFIRDLKLVKNVYLDTLAKKGKTVDQYREKPTEFTPDEEALIDRWVEKNKDNGANRENVIEHLKKTGKL